MALDIKDVIILGKMGFTKTDIAALMGAQPRTPAQTTPAPVAPQSAPVAVPVTQTNAPAAPDYGALVAGTDRALIFSDRSARPATSAP